MQTDISVIIPVYNGGESFVRCLESIGRLTPPPLEVIVVDDGSTDDSAPLARERGHRLRQTGGRCGPAVARNLGAQAAAGGILFFVDADVTVRPDAVAMIAACFERETDLAALIGSYDDEPAATNFLSQYKNLAHHYVHQQSAEESGTFWGACGAVRRECFLRLGGFDESYRTPSIEDIELGLRICRDGGRIRLLKQLQVKHLKEWRWRSLLRAELLLRAWPWTRLILRARHMPNDLNLRWGQRLSVALALLLPLLLIAAVWDCRWLVAGLLAGLSIIGINRALAGFFWRRRGLWFATRAMLWHLFYYFYSGSVFGAGVVAHCLSGIRGASGGGGKAVDHS